MIPVINIRYSKIYDHKFRNEKSRARYPKTSEILDYVDMVRGEWYLNGRKILKEIARITGLKWRDPFTICYVATEGRSFSDPLTIKILGTDKKFIIKEDFVDMLTHELIHQIFIQNGKRADGAEMATIGDYVEEPPHTTAHILTHAVHKHIYLKFFGSSRLKKDIERARKPKNREYRRAWEIVEDEGHLNLLRRFRENLKVYRAVK